MRTLPRSALLALCLLTATGVAWAQPADLASRLASRWGPGFATFRTGANGVGRTLLGAPGIDERESEALVAEIAVLSGVDPDDLPPARVVSHREAGGTRELRRFDRIWQGARVLEDEVLVVIVNGRIGAVWVRLGSLSGVGTPRAGEVVVRRPDGTAVLARPVARRDRIEWLDRAGRVVRIDRTVHTDALTLTHEARLPDDALVTVAARGVTVTDRQGTSGVTDEEGATALTGPFDVALDGPRLTVSSAGAIVTARNVSDGDLLAGVDVPHEAANVLAGYDVVRDWIAARWSDPALLDEPVTAAVDDLLYPCNAYYDSGVDHLGFSPAREGCLSMARFADIVFHETAHRVHWRIIVAGGFASDVSEGSSDYVAATLNDDPIVAPGVYGPDTAIREIDTDRMFPADRNGEPHNDGRIWGSFLWNLRADWITELGDVEGVDAVDRLLLRVLEQGPRLNELWAAVLVADDDDGDLSNGTPRDCALLDLLEHHGLGPSSLGATAIDHVPPAAPGSNETAYPVSFALPPAYPRCGQQEVTTVTLRWTTDATAPLPAIGEQSSAWSSVALAAVDGRFAGELPRQPANSQVLYLIEMGRDDGRTFASHGDRHEGLFGFWVGDRRVLWCDDLEGDLSGWHSDVGVPFLEDVPDTAVNDWEFGTPTGGTEPDSASSGSIIAATSLGGDYLPNNAEQLLSPPIDLEGRGVMRLLELQRWLAVEDGLFDRASVWAERAGGEGWALVWSNSPTVMGITHHVDGEWKKRAHALGPALALDGSHAGPLRIAFTLESDGGLELAGWAIDDPCVVELDEPERHYRAQGLSAEVRPNGLDVGLSWTMPWIRPVTNVRVVRKQGEPPAGAEDGAVVGTPDAAQWIPGGEIALTDFGVEPGEWHYAVFLAGGGGPSDFWETVVPGENTASVTIEAEPEPDAGASGDDGGPGGDAGSPGGGDDGGGCGCRAAGSGARGGGAALALALFAFVAVLVRRRRARIAIGALALLACGGGDDDPGQDAAVGLDAALDAALDAEASPDTGVDASAPAPDGCGPWVGHYVGRRRTYHGQNPGGDDEHTDEVLSFGEDGAIRVREEYVMSAYGQRTWTKNYRCAPDGLYELGYDYQTIRADGTSSSGTVTNSAPALILPRNPAPGDTWSIDVMRQVVADDGQENEYPYTWSYEVAEEQLVSTHAGSWRALRLTGDGGANGMSATFWAEDVGKVLSVGFLLGSQSELVSLDDSGRTD